MDKKNKIPGNLENTLRWMEKIHTIYQNQWDVTKAEHRGKYVAINPSIEKVERSQIHDLTSYFKILEMKEN